MLVEVAEIKFAGKLDREKFDLSEVLDYQIQGFILRVKWITRERQKFKTNQKRDTDLEKTTADLKEIEARIENLKKQVREL